MADEKQQKQPKKYNPDQPIGKVALKEYKRMWEQNKRYKERFYKAKILITQLFQLFK